MSTLIGLSGFARVGKDTAAMNMRGFTRFAFADPLKADIAPLLEMIGCDIMIPHHKEKARPLLVEWGATARRFNPNFWIERTLRAIRESPSDKIAITDVRYANEVAAILAQGGKVIRIDRPAHGPANAEERLSFELLDRRYPALPRVMNDSTPEILGARIEQLIFKSERDENARPLILDPPLSQRNQGFQKGAAHDAKSL
ncbi:MAG: hypothetical protein AAB229_05455 [Candidatus Hydrogenedentota bacterium]